MASSALQRLVRFVPRSSPSKILIGQPADKDIDVGAALRKGQEVTVNVWSGSSVLSPGSSTGITETIDRVLSPLAQNEIGTIRCVGLNYRKHAAECGLDPPAIPVIFMKPATTIVDPWPARGTIPKLSQVDESGDYEAELAVVIGKTAKNVSEAEALDYVLGYTAANDVSSRTQQLNQSQWSFSKSFDGACPLGPTLVLKSLITDPTKLHMRGLKNGEVYQESGTDDLIFSVPKIISWLSQGTTLPPGTVIVTGTPAGVGMGRTPKDALRHGDEFAVEILPHIGTLTNIFENEKSGFMTKLWPWDLGSQFAKARGYRVIAIENREAGLRLASGSPSNLQSDLILKLDDPETIQKISDFTDGIGLKVTIVCTSEDAANDWAAQRLQPRGVLVAAGFPEHGLKFDLMNLILREIFVKGTVHCSMGETREMMKSVVQHGIRSHLTLLTMEEAEDIAAKSEAHTFMGGPVVIRNALFSEYLPPHVGMRQPCSFELFEHPVGISTAIFWNHWPGGAFKSLACY
ncbi:bifunctional 4-hydroxyphenylacetate degradation enzyme [Fusarium phyllophilum]|uniref:Bifunctional 4-hydroxyphenylacetate degradation enzyme n=1 Tax=Fusarium phyllophilum TaxID=47803 RepID=A0A8H5JW81_9HYPO|nr:bifunctional 4-hydroxyphenylacetate degradation enzyme [Fusarium phyllophilum]